MNVAVRSDQHSMRLGHLALSHTVSSFSSSISRAVKWSPFPLGMFFFSQRGKRLGHIGQRDDRKRSGGAGRVHARFVGMRRVEDGRFAA